MADGYDDMLKGQWLQAKGWVREQWGELTDDDIDVVDGRAEQLAGRIQERYGMGVEDARREVAGWLRRHFGNAT